VAYENDVRRRASAVLDTFREAARTIEHQLFKLRNFCNRRSGFVGENARDYVPVLRALRPCAG